MRVPLTFRALLVSASLLAGTGGTTPVSAAPADPSRTTSDTSNTRLSMAFDAPGRALSDGARVPGLPTRTSGTVVTDGMARIKHSKGVTGRAARFPCLTCGRAIIKVEDRNSLDPRDDAFSFGVSVRVTPRQAAGSMNVVQKGWFDEPGGQYKLQVDQGHPSCVINGSAGRAILTSGLDVADSTWHGLICERSGNTVTLLVDGVVAAQKSAETGHLNNAAPVWIGGKEIGTVDPDQFRGRMDDVFVSIVR